ncbi:Microcystin-dependent protein [Paenibacillus algorifonticola]|uniref:Microcystin-dependent protein n=1 Tax=Paenibacillus algorifonticola TaxID=684063 RepID=A0A1I2F662_9BACL|nr:tail fiber protein [Paenibacillus algorifonticola]SFF00459.1 Microcystin-dependent protein [Paenibacillus algorifonticola]
MEPFIGEIRAFPYGFTPKGWAPCNGQIMAISSNQALFSILGTTYGGNGRDNFALPNLQGRVPVHVGQRTPLGSAAGAANHNVTVNEMPMHTHQLAASSETADQISPAGNVWADTPYNPYAASPANVSMNAGAIATAGGSQPHNNMQPYLALNFCIAIRGIFPPRN